MQVKDRDIFPFSVLEYFFDIKRYKKWQNDKSLF